MQRLWKHADGSYRQPFIVGSDRWMANKNADKSDGKTADNSDDKNADKSDDKPSSDPSDSVSSPISNQADQQRENPSSQDPSVRIYTPETGLRSNSLHAEAYPGELSAIKMPSESRIYPDVYQGRPEFEKPDLGSHYPDIFAENAENASAIGEKGGNFYPDVYSGTARDEEASARDYEAGSSDPRVVSSSADTAADYGLESQQLEQTEPVETAVDVLVRLPETMVHLIDEQGSALLASGEFSLVKLVQNGNGIAIFARVGDDFQWPITKDEATAKLDSAHYFFTLRAADEEEGESSSEGVEKSDKTSPPTYLPVETLSYGVTFTVKGNEEALKELEKLLEQYSLFSTPTIVQGDAKDREKVLKNEAGAIQIDENTGKTLAIADSTQFPGKAVPSELVRGSDGKKPSDEITTAYWTTMAPNVEDYNSSLAKAIAAGTGHVIRGIFWCTDSTVSNLQKGGTLVKGYLKPGSKQAPVSSSRTLKNIRRAKKISKMSQKTANAILSGVLTTVGFFSSTVLSSKMGKKVFTLMPGEVALVSLDAFGKIFDAVEVAGKNVLSATSVVTSDVVSHRFGEHAAEMTHEGLATVGYAAGTIWTISKIRKALNPKGTAKPSVMKTAAKAVYGGIKKK